MKGFTLIELLVVVLIIGILSAVALPQYTKAVEKSRAAEALSMMKSLSTGFEEYVLANGSLPPSFDVLSVVPSNVEPNGSGCINFRSFQYCIQHGPRLQSWRINGLSSYGFIWYSSMQNIGVAGKQFYCFEQKNSQAQKMGICKAVGGRDKFQSPTASTYEWYVLD
ncbi:MAG: prepilin-type N-terminal cleavage/methylation domain-containing protein [Elusimicrobia bacterium]|nr:prepilin-type N-terminal cleavage/methylation domain-containing protein [Elusimicrobiota bacterium]MDY6040192.1 prepilin-type N-terminal cleavage/methylation domain-containing protein [Elusimicrobiaceae bacterium]